MSIQKISGVTFNQANSASKNAHPQQNLALPRELSNNSSKHSQVAFKGDDCGAKHAAFAAGACIATGLGSWIQN